jgi:hypothetical protein
MIFFFLGLHTFTFFTLNTLRLSFSKLSMYSYSSWPALKWSYH